MSNSIFGLVIVGYNVPSMMCVHSVKGFPVYPGLQEQTGLCFITLQKVLTPQDPGQGSMHCSF